METEPLNWVVIGSNSFSGSDFVDLLLADERNRVWGVSRSPEKGPLFLPYLRRESDRFQFHQLDLNRDMAGILDLLRQVRPHFVVNFAAQSEVAPSWKHPDQWFQTNAVAVAALSNYLKDQEWLRRYVHISSPEVYGTCEGTVTEESPVNPSTPYAASKAAGDMMLSTLAKHFDFPLVTIRATNVYGAHQQLFKIIPRTAIYLRQGRRIQLHGGGVAVKSYIHIRDVSRGTLLAAVKGGRGSMFHLSPDRGVEVREVVRTMCELAGKDFSSATEAVEERLGQDRAYVIDSSRARAELGWTPEVTLDGGLRGVIDWVESNWSAIQAEPLEYQHRP